MARRPSNGNIGDGFGWRAKHPITGRRTFHYGEDIGWAKGTRLVAPISGELSYYYHSGFGNLVTITNGNTAVRLGHTARLAPDIENGQWVNEGQHVAVMGATGRAVGVHVHWEVLVNGVQIDPAQWLTQVAKVESEKIKEVVNEMSNGIKYYATRDKKANKTFYGIFGMEYPGGYEISTSEATGAAWGKLYGKDDGDAWDILDTDVWETLKREAKVINERYVAQMKTLFS